MRSTTGEAVEVEARRATWQEISIAWVIVLSLFAGLIVA
jgi:hypothetical protein